MTTTTEEIARVRFIHGELDRAARWYLQQRSSYDGTFKIVPYYSRIEDRVEHSYTAEEVRRWPEVKATMLLKLTEWPELGIAVRYASTVDGPSYGVGVWESRDQRNGPLVCHANSLARGLCLYREMLDAGPARDEQACGHNAIDHRSGHCSVCGAADTYQEPAAKAPDPYNPHGMGHEQHLRNEANIAAVMNDGTCHYGQRNLAARSRLIASLRAEQAWRERPDMLKTFPKAARNPR